MGTAEGPVRRPGGIGPSQQEATPSPSTPARLPSEVGWATLRSGLGYPSRRRARLGATPLDAGLG
jgi:hypothetical protein